MCRPVGVPAAQVPTSQSRCRARSPSPVVQPGRQPGCQIWMDGLLGRVSGRSDDSAAPRGPPLSVDPSTRISTDAGMPDYQSRDTYLTDSRVGSCQNHALWVGGRILRGVATDQRGIATDQRTRQIGSARLGAIPREREEADESAGALPATDRQGLAIATAIGGDAERRDVAELLFGVSHDRDGRQHTRTVPSTRCRSNRSSR